MYSWWCHWWCYPYSPFCFPDTTCCVIILVLHCKEFWLFGTCYIDNYFGLVESNHQVLKALSCLKMLPPVPIQVSQTFFQFFVDNQSYTWSRISLIAWPVFSVITRDCGLIVFSQESNLDHFMLWRNTLYDISSVGSWIWFSRAQVVVDRCLARFLTLLFSWQWTAEFAITFYILNNWAGVGSKDGVWLKWSSLLPALWPPL